MYPTTRMTRATVALAAIVALLLPAGCSEPEPEPVYEVPEGASAAETSPGQPTPPPAYQQSSGLPGPPPGPPPVQ
jgi:hypothetical protein